jgi:hypothetical protein
MPEPAAPPSRVARAVIAGAIAVLSALLALREARTQGAWWVAGDFTYWWRAARVLLDGQSPYAVIQPTGGYPFQGRFVYPLPAALAALPFAALAPVHALAAFSAVSGGLLAWAVTRNGYRHLPLFLSPAYLWCAAAGQWGALLMAAALTPALGWVATVKPTLGLAMLAYRPSRLAVGLCALVGVVSLAVRPGWVMEWLATTAQERGNYDVPLTAFVAGPLILAALLRWRRPEARLLVLMACVPQSFFFYDQVPLWLVPATFWESALLTGLAWAARLAYGAAAAPLIAATPRDFPPVPVLAEIAKPIVVAMLYLPCALFVLRRPNVAPGQDARRPTEPAGAAARQGGDDPPRVASVV